MSEKAQRSKCLGNLTAILTHPNIYIGLPHTDKDNDQIPRVLFGVFSDFPCSYQRWCSHCSVLFPVFFSFFNIKNNVFYHHQIVAKTTVIWAIRGEYGRVFTKLHTYIMINHLKCGEYHFKWSKMINWRWNIANTWKKRIRFVDWVTIFVSLYWFLKISNLFYMYEKLWSFSNN